MCVAKNTLRGESVFSTIYGRKSAGRSDFCFAPKGHSPFGAGKKAAERCSAALSAIPVVLLSPLAAVLAVLGVLRVLGILGVLGIVLGVLNVLGVLAILVIHEFAPPFICARLGCPAKTPLMHEKNKKIPQIPVDKPNGNRYNISAKQRRSVHPPHLPPQAKRSTAIYKSP